MNSTRSWRRIIALVVTGSLSLFLAMGTAAQVQTHTYTTSGEPTHEVMVKTATVVLVDGNNLIVRYPDGSLRHFPNVPESFRANIDGQSLGIHDLRPGMTLEHTVVRTTTPQTITTVQTVKGKIFHVNPPRSLILTLENGTNQSFKIPEGQKFDVNGQMVDAWGLRKGMMITATRIVEEPQTLVSQSSTVTGSAPPPPPPDRPILVVMMRRSEPMPAPESTASEESAQAPAQENARLPNTGSTLPLIGLLGLLCLVGSAGLQLLRK